MSSPWNRHHAVFLSLLVAAVGCSSGVKEYGTAKVTGKLMCEDEPVGDAIVFFAPLQSAEGKGANTGKQGIGRTDAFGEFVVSTYGENDGAVVGKHRITVKTPPSCPCATNPDVAVMEVEIKPGEEHNFEVKVKKTGDKRSQGEGEDD